MLEMVDVIENCENLIRIGKYSDARKLLLSLNLTQISRRTYKSIANLSYRVGLPLLSVRLLKPIVYPISNSIEPASDLEKTEYAASLTLLGSTNEANKILATVDHVKVPRASLYKAFVHFSEWTYISSIPFLEHYSQFAETQYQRHVGDMNLGAALVAIQSYEKALMKLEELEKQLATKPNFTVLNSTRILMAQALLGLNQITQAREKLGQAASCHKETQGLTDFLIKKWDLIIKLHEEKPSALTLDRVQKIKKYAAQNTYWESVRDFDYYKALRTNDTALLIKLYFGTVFQSYRDKIIKNFGKPLLIPQSYIWSNAPESSTDNIIDMSDIGLKEGQLMQHLVSLLSSDFYKPFSVGAVHTHLWPNEIFDAVSTPRKVNQLIFRLRTHLENRNIPIKIGYKAHGFSIEEPLDFSLKLELKAQMKNRSEAVIQQLISQFGNSEFAAKQACDILGISRGQFLIISRIGIKNQDLVRIGNGKHVRYKFAS